MKVLQTRVAGRAGIDDRAGSTARSEPVRHPGRVASQHGMAPPQTMAAPFQKSGARSSTVERAADSTGMKYEAPASIR